MAAPGRRKYGRARMAATYSESVSPGTATCLRASERATTASALRAKDFLTAVQTAGSCCGFDDAAAQEQNPPLLECSSETACKSIFLAEVTRVVITKCVVIFVLGTIEIISLLLVCGLTCRREKDVAFKKSKSHIGNTVKV